MLLVVDASVFVAELLRRRGQRLMRDPRLDLTVSERAYEEALHELPKRADAIVDQGRMTRETINAVLQDAIELTEREVTVVPRDAYAHRIEQAAYRIPRDPDDAPIVALALALGGDEGRCGIWTQDADFLGCGIPTWTTDTLLAHLRYER